MYRDSSLTKRPRYQTKTDRQTVKFETLFIIFFVGYRNSYLRALLVCLCYQIKRKYGKKSIQEQHGWMLWGYPQIYCRSNKNESNNTISRSHET